MWLSVLLCELGIIFLGRLGFFFLAFLRGVFWAWDLLGFGGEGGVVVLIGRACRMWNLLLSFQTRNLSILNMLLEDAGI